MNLRTMPTLTAERLPGGWWRLEMPGGTEAVLPTFRACQDAARGVYAAVRPVSHDDGDDAPFGAGDSVEAFRG